MSVVHGHFAMHVPTAEIARQSLVSASATVAAAVEQTRSGCTAAAEAFPAWSTSAALRAVHAVHAAAITGHASDLGSHADRLSSSMGVAQRAEENIRQSLVAAALNCRA